MSPSNISAAVQECLSVAARSPVPFEAAADYLRELSAVHGCSEADVRKVAKLVARELLSRAS